MITKKIRAIYQEPFLRFLVVGAINTAFGYGLFCLLIFLQVHYLLAISIAYVAGVIFNFKTIGYFVFKNTEKQLLFRFTGVYFFLYFVNLVALQCFKKIVADVYLAGAMTVVVAALISYLLNKHLVFQRKKNEKN